MKIIIALRSYLLNPGKKSFTFKIHFNQFQIGGPYCLYLIQDFFVIHYNQTKNVVDIWLKDIYIMRNFIASHSSMLYDDIPANELEGILKATKQDDKEAADKLFKYLYPKIYRYLFYRVKRREDVEDLAGTVILKIIRGLKSQKGNFMAWVYKIASNSVIDFYRRQAVRKETGLNEMSSNRAVGDISPKRDIDSEVLKEALSHLTAEQATVINLKFLQEYTNEEVAKITGKTIGAVKVLQFRALQALRKYFREKGYEVKD